ncbi:MAG TPA: hypothetical protein ENI85_06285, partial [Deltaproteobacteria bacterium]|nr:hypothetical protein [Deltaproteobacteria bacterium]
MYTAFYGLREKPFALSPDPRFLYLAGPHREALAHLLYGIEQGEGFISVTGEVGTGKTTLCRTLLERLDGDTELAFLFNPSRTALELLQSICAEFELPAEGLTRRSLMTQLNRFLLEQKAAGRRVLLIIDEAQNLSENTLEQVRLLSNLETSREKLIQILLLGQPELDRKLDSRGLRQLRQRISVRWQLEPLRPQETRAYVRHRIAVAAGEPRELFSEGALREIHRRTGGVPRLVNQLCDRALLGGYAARSALIRPAQVRAAAREIPDARRRHAREKVFNSFLRPWMFVAGSVAVAGLALVAGLQVGRHGLARAFGVDARPSSASIAEPAGSAIGELPAVAANAPDAANAARLARPRGFVSGTGTGEATPSRGDPAVQGVQPSSILAAAASLDREPLVRTEVAALAPGLLSQILAGLDPRRALRESEAAVLERHGRPLRPGSGSASPPRDAADLQSAFEARGLSATSFDGGSIELLRRLDHPVLLPLSPDPNGSGSRGPADASTEEGGDTRARWVAITGFEGDRARIAGLVRDRIVSVPIRELAAHWLETGMLVWERFEPVPELLKKGEDGPGVLWLQRALARLRFFEGRPTGAFDRETATAVRDFQREQGLVADGIAGPLTQIALYARLDQYPVPRLSDPPGTERRTATSGLRSGAPRPASSAGRIPPGQPARRADAD